MTYLRRNWYRYFVQLFIALLRYNTIVKIYDHQITRDMI